MDKLNPTTPHPKNSKADFSPRGASAPPSPGTPAEPPSRARSKRLFPPHSAPATKITAPYYAPEWPLRAIPRPQIRNRHARLLAQPETSKADFSPRGASAPPSPTAQTEPPSRARSKRPFPPDSYAKWPLRARKIEIAALAS